MKSKWLCLGLVLAFSASAGEAPPPFPELLKQLNSEDFQMREMASKALANLPPDGLLAVEAELKKQGVPPEVRTRLSAALPALRARHAVALIEAETLRILEWNRKTLTDAYMKVGKRDAKWDEAALKALDLTAPFFVYPAKRTDASNLEIENLAKKALDAGCDDGLIQYLHVRLAEERNGMKKPQLIEGFESAARKMKAQKYPPNRLFFSWMRAFTHLRSYSGKQIPAPNLKGLQMHLAEMLPLIGEMARDPSVPRSHVHDACKQYIDESANLPGTDRRASFDQVAKLLPPEVLNGPVGLSVKGEMLVNYAWDARGGGYANTVTEDGWKKMGERLSEAREALEKSYELDPLYAPASLKMLTVELGQSRGREAMELWYQRARTANPNDLAVYGAKMYWLEPKWHGSEEEMLAFGHELLKEGNWAARIPIKLVDAHFALARYRNRENLAEHFTSPGVWEDMKAVYEGYLTRYPDSKWDQSRYAYIAGQCGKWDVVAQQFKKLGNAIDVSAFDNPKQLEDYKRRAAAGK